jgi:hypothetical protein
MHGKEDWFFESDDDDDDDGVSKHKCKQAAFVGMV